MGIFKYFERVYPDAQLCDKAKKLAGAAKRLEKIGMLALTDLD